MMRAEFEEVIEEVSRMGKCKLEWARPMEVTLNLLLARIYMLKERGI